MPEKKKSVIFALIFVAAVFLSFRIDGIANDAAAKYRSIYLDIFFSTITSVVFVILAMYVVPSIALYNKKRNGITLLSAALALSILLSAVIKITFLRERPNMETGYEIFSVIDYSFPSMHSMIVFSLLPILISDLKKQKIMWIFLAFMIAFSRIYLHFHFLSDVVAGSLIGYCIGYLILRYRKIQQANKKNGTKNI